ncbi:MULTISPECIES: ABC transporter permease subunit [unclassified Clostridioides]|uniref:ABC transporter permease subunit n=1 Tax=unclassified Clostridioides TaxID=2635829 RepID=UPI001D0C54E5
MLISIVFGTAVGVISGYIGGKLDQFLMRLVDMLMSIPSFLVLIVLNTYLAPKASIKKLSQLLVH